METQIFKSKIVKKAKDEKGARDIQETYKDMAHGFLQWKGTDACMDVYCECGSQFHFDGYFIYNIECPNCGSIYACNPHIELVKLEVRPDSCLHLGEV